MSENIYRRTLSQSESHLLSSLAAAGFTVFTTVDARALLKTGSTDISKLLHRLNRKGWLKRLERGKYLIIPLEAGPEAQWAEHEYLVAASLASPYYLAYATPLHYYGYSDLPLNPVTIAVTRRKRSVAIGGLTYQFVAIKSEKFFGYQPISLLGNTIQMAEREKAIADGLDRPDLVGGVLEAAKGLYFGKDELDWEKLAAYARRLQNQAAMRRLGFWLELLAVSDDRMLAQLSESKGHSYALLDPAGPPDGARSARWRLIINIPERQLLEWQAH